MTENNFNRSFIIDYGCCLPFGHNLQSVKLYKDREVNRKRNATAIVCSRIGYMEGDNYTNFDFILPSVYKNLIATVEDNSIKRVFFSFLSRFIRIPFFGKSSIALIQAKSSVNNLYSKYKFNKDDLIIFPSAEYYGVKAFLEHIATIPKEERPRMHIRFIGVLEFTQIPFQNSLYDLIKLINENHYTVQVSAEVPIYAKYLNNVLPNIEVKPEPYPIVEQEILLTKPKKNKCDTFYILLPGTNRIDKGYFDLYNIVKETLYHYPKVQFIIQDMKEYDKKFSKSYQKKLSLLPNLELLEAVQTRKKIEEMYEKANLILLPYDPGTYYYRGSAIHYEAIMNKIPVLARKGCGFTDEITQWSSGWIYETKKDLLSHLGNVIDMEANAIENKMDTALENFRRSSDEATNFYLS